MAASTAVLYYSTEYHNSRQNIIVLFWKYLVAFRSKAGQNIFREYINLKLFAVSSIYFNQITILSDHFQFETLLLGHLLSE